MTVLEDMKKKQTDLNKNYEEVIKLLKEEVAQLKIQIKKMSHPHSSPAKRSVNQDFGEA